MREPQNKVMRLEEALAWRAQLRATARRLVMTNGCFDLIHRGHVQYLAAARRCGDALLVAVNSDASVRAIKGPERPIVPESDRTYMLASLEAVDAVVVFATPTATGLLRALRPDVYVKGGDYTLATIEPEERQFLQTTDCRIQFVPAVEGLSTTELIRRVRDAGPGKGDV